MPKAKFVKSSETKAKIPPKLPFSGFSRFGGNKGGFGAINSQKFSGKSFVTRPTFVTQHKGGGGGK